MAQTTLSVPSIPSQRRWSDLLALVVAMVVLWVVSLIDDAQDVHDAALLLLPALLLVAGAFAGRVAEHAHLPRLTGYIVLGVVAGPAVLQLVEQYQVDLIKGVNQLAIGLIALMAGAEIRLSWLRKRIVAVVVCALASAAVTPLAVQQLLIHAPGLFPFMDGLDAAVGGRVAMPALLAGTVFLATSPMVVVSVIKDTRSSGPLAEMSMGLAVFKDVVVLLGFTLLMAVTRGLADGDAGTEHGAGLLLSVGGETLFHVLLSVVVGIPIGWGLAWLSEREYTRFSWLLVGASLGVALLQPMFHIEPLFCLLAAGFACENLWPRRSAWGTHHLERGLSQVAAPVFVIFFVAAGLGVDLAGLGDSWLAVVLLALVRLVSFWLGLEVGCRLSAVEPGARRHLWLASVPQAGVTLGLAALLGEAFPGWGESLRDVIIACVALHELVGPILLTWVLKRTGETGQAAS